MAEVSYPVHMHKHLHAPLYANEKKEIDGMEAAGWTSERRNIGPQEYPRMLYSETGETMIVGNYQDGGEFQFNAGRPESFRRQVLVVDLEAAQQEEARYIAEGWSRTPVASGMLPEAPVNGILEAISNAKENASRLNALEGDVAEIKSGMSEILAALGGKRRAKQDA